MWKTSKGQSVIPVNGATLRYYRKRAGRNGAAISQYDLAKESGLSRSYIAEIEQGRKQPRELAAEKLAKVLGVHVDDLVRSVEEPESDLTTSS